MIGGVGLIPGSSPALGEFEGRFVMRVHFLQHVPFEDADNIGVWATRRGHEMTCTRLDLGQPLPALNAFDWLVVMGGPMNIYEHDRYPWLAREKEFIRAAIDRGAPFLGVCLGAQLAADVLGGPVTRNRQQEIGWFPVSLTAAARDAAVLRGLPERFLAFHWHGDTFAIPPGAVRMAESDACANQAFLYGDRVVGLQFHLDYSPAGIQRMVRHCGAELVEGPAVQPAESLLAEPQRAAETQELLERFLDSLQRVGGPES
jgi:GMP synthase-like glutamine amidotransferase